MGLAHGFMLISIAIMFPFAQRAILASGTQPPFEPTLLIPPETTTSAPTVVSNDSNFALSCNASSTWLAPGFDFDATYSDCVNAVLEILDVASAYQGLHFEFLAAGQTPTRGSFVKRTPLRYTFRSCTALIVNLGNFPPAYLPEHDQRRYPTTDFASYYELHDRLDMVLRICMENPLRAKALGWASAGERSGLGVFLVGKGSDLDQHVPASAQLEVL